MPKRLKSILLFGVLSTIIITSLLLPQKTKASRKWQTIKQWRGSFTVDRRVSKKASLNGMTETIKLVETTTGSAILNEKYTEDDWTTWTGPSSATTSITATRTLSFGPVTLTETVTGNGTSRDINEYGEGSGITIDISKGTYDVGFAGGKPELKWKREVDGATKSAISKIEVTPVRDYFLALMKGLEKGRFSTGLTSGIGFLPGNQLEFSDFKSMFKKQQEQGPKLPAKPGKLSGTKDYNRKGTTIKTTWSLSPTDDELPEYFLTVENLEEYKTLLPEPNKKVRLKVYTKDKNPIPVPIRFTMEDCSKEPGTCLNSDTTETDYDLDFDLASGGTPLYRDGKFSVRTREAESLAYVDLNIKDYGAYANIYAEIELDGIRIRMKVDYFDDKYLAFPWDENGNKVADQWEKQHKIFNKYAGKEPGWDEEKKPEIDGEPGDGFSLYEEYRGMKVKGHLYRMDPNIKELVIENRSKHAKIRKGIRLFSNASGIKVIELTVAELPKSRVVNTNSKKHRNLKQHGIIVLAKLLPGNIMGQTIPLESKNRTPKDVDEIQINTLTFEPWSNLTADAKVGRTQKAWEQEASVTLAHELGHAVGAGHHGDSDHPSQVIYSNDLVLDAQGNPVADRPRSSGDPTGGIGGQSSGNMHCLMIYNGLYNYLMYYKDRIRVYQQVPVEGWPLPSIFCTSKEGTALNKNGKWFGDATTGGDCLHQLRVKDNR